MPTGNGLGPEPCLGEAGDVPRPPPAVRRDRGEPRHRRFPRDRPYAATGGAPCPVTGGRRVAGSRRRQARCAAERGGDHIAGESTERGQQEQAVDA